MKNPCKTLIENFREMIDDFRQQYPGGIREYIQERRKGWAEYRAAKRHWKELTVEERAYRVIIQGRKTARAKTADGFIFTEQAARNAMRALHGGRLNYVVFDDGLTTAVLKDGQILEYDEAARRIN